jgi:hypothetical protein
MGEGGTGHNTTTSPRKQMPARHMGECLARHAEAGRRRRETLCREHQLEGPEAALAPTGFVMRVSRKAPRFSGCWRVQWKRTHTRGGERKKEKGGGGKEREKHTTIHTLRYVSSCGDAGDPLMYQLTRRTSAPKSRSSCATVYGNFSAANVLSKASIRSFVAACAFAARSSPVARCRTTGRRNPAHNSTCQCHG